MNPGVFAHHATAGIHNLASRGARRDALLAEVGIDERGVVTVRDEADLLAVGLFGHRQSELTGELADLGLPERAHREERPGELVLRQAEQEIRLVLALIDAPAH